MSTGFEINVKSVILPWQNEITGILKKKSFTQGTLGHVQYL